MGQGQGLGFLARCFEGGGERRGLLAFEVVKSGDSDFWLWYGRNKKKEGHGASRVEQAVGEQAGESSRAE